MEKFSAAFTCLMFGIFVTKVASIECYDCGYRFTNGCEGGNITEEFLKSCPVGYDYCVTRYLKGTNWLIGRGCSTAAVNTCIQEQGSTFCYKACSTDGCNDDSVEDHQSQLASERIKCYQCAYSSDSGENGCNNLSNISSKYLNNCPAGHKYCDTWNITSDRNQTVISRGCSVEDRDFCFILGEDSACISTCDTDGCNSGDTIRSGIMACITATIVFLFYV
ncbi:unnamed protein product [Clavelina lepadiformis]|uniref:Uncharacterized protein n=1 Tax=Clavelina lepadiformis TaxID=159417 RepID=A0ABP0FL79_CLALP